MQMYLITALLKAYRGPSFSIRCSAIQQSTQKRVLMIVCHSKGDYKTLISTGMTQKFGLKAPPANAGIGRHLKVKEQKNDHKAKTKKKDHPCIQHTRS